MRFSSRSITTASPSGPANRPSTASRTAPGSTAKATLSAWPRTPRTKQASASASIFLRGTGTITRYPDVKAYDKYYLAQLDELAQHYGPLTEFWIDGAGSAGRTYDFDTIITELRTYQPNTLVFADVALYKYADLRWVGNESGTVPYENWNVIDRAGYLRWRPVEADTPLHRGHWFWHANDESTLRSVDELLDIYTKTVGRGAQLMLGLAPDNTGRSRPPTSNAFRVRRCAPPHLQPQSRCTRPRRERGAAKPSTTIPAPSGSLLRRTPRSNSSSTSPSPSTAP